MPLQPNELPNGVTHEWNYLSEWPAIANLSRHPDLSDQAPTNLLEHVKRMHAAAPPDKKIQQQYNDTESAITRMMVVRETELKRRQL